MKKMILTLGAGLLAAALEASPAITVSSVEKESGRIAAVNLSISGLEGPADLIAAMGLTAGNAEGVDGWESVETLGTLAAGTVSFRYVVPEAWGKTLFNLRFFLAADKLYDNALDYVESADSKPIHLGFAPGPNTVSRLKFHYLNSGGGVFYGYYPYGWDDANDYRFFYAGGTLYFDFPVNGTRVSTQSFTFDAVNELELGNFYIKDLASGTVIAQGSPQEFATPEAVVRDANEMAFFGHPNDDQDKGRIYSLDVYDRASAEDELALVHSFRPVLKDNVAGLYDSKTGAFILPDEGGAALTYGKVLPYDGPMSAASDLVSAIENPDAPFIATAKLAGTGMGFVTFELGVFFATGETGCDIFAEVTGRGVTDAVLLTHATANLTTATVSGLRPGDTYSIRLYAVGESAQAPVYYDEGRAFHAAIPGICESDGTYDYVLLDYIEADGTQYIDTGLKVTPATEVDMLFWKLGNDVANGVALLGVAWDEAGFFLQAGYYYYQPLNVWAHWFQFDSGGSVQQVYTPEGWSADEWTRIHMSHTAFDINDKHWDLNPVRDDNPNNNLYIFTTPGGYNKGTGRLRHLKIYEGNKVLRNCWAASNLTTHAVGLLDVKNKVFYASAVEEAPLIASATPLDPKDYERKPGMMIVIR